MKKVIPPKTRIKLIEDKVGDLPKSLMRRKGTVIKRWPGGDEFLPVNKRIRAYRVLMDGRKKVRMIFEDEIEILKP